MTARKPLVLINGGIAELPANDTISGAAGGTVVGSPMVCESVAAGTTTTIPTGYQMAVHGAYVVEGTLNIDGKLVMP